MEKLFYSHNLKTLIHSISELTLEQAREYVKNHPELHNLQIEDEKEFVIQADPWTPQEGRRRKIQRYLKHHIID